MVNSAEAFVEAVLRVAREQGFPIELGRTGLRQVDFGHKKLHEDHLRMDVSRNFG